MYIVKLLNCTIHVIILLICYNYIKKKNFFELIANLYINFIVIKNKGLIWGICQVSRVIFGDIFEGALARYHQSKYLTHTQCIKQAKDRFDRDNLIFLYSTVLPSIQPVRGGSSIRVSTMVVTQGSGGMIIDGVANIF